MIISEWLNTAEKLLNATSSTPRLDAEVLLVDEIGNNKAWLLAHGDQPLQGATLQRLESQLKRRVTSEPLAYIRGFAEFYGRRFEVNEHVLVPRPESEAMIELLLEQIESRKSEGISGVDIVDVGTGSGILGITTTLELQKLTTYGLGPTTYLLDIDPNCLKVAKKNAKTHRAEVNLLQGNLLEPLSTIDLSLTTIILANLPYVPDEYEINAAAKHEPKLALFAGKDGLDLYRELFKQVLSRKPKASSISIFTESLLFQHEQLRKIAEDAGFIQAAGKDLIQVFSPKPNA